MAKDMERQRAIGARLKKLRGPKPQPLIADEVGVTLRAYQAWEGGESGISWANLKGLAEHFHVSENYILYGEEKPRGPQSQMDRIEGALDELRTKLDQLLEPEGFEVREDEEGGEEGRQSV